MIKKPLKVGMKVKVINNGATYSRWKDKAKDMGAKNWNYDDAPNNGNIGIVKAVSPHPEDINYQISLVNINNQDFLIGHRGLEQIGDYQTEIQ